MSKIKVNRLENTSTANGGIDIDTSGHVQVDGLQMPTAGPLSNRNMIINGAMVHDQRSNGAVFNTTGPTYGTCDRWSFQYSQSSKYTGQQVSDGPAGFEKSLKATVTNSTSVGSVGYFVVEQSIEGYNSSSLAWGSADAKAISISFWVKASVTGTYSLAIRNADYSRTRVEEYTIQTANTWEYKTITVPGDTTGTYNTTDGVGIRILFDLGVGTAYSGTAGVWNAGNKFSTSNSVHLIETQGATWQITGVQVEVGSKATPFEHESYGQTLAKCQRYTQVYKYPNTYQHICQGIISSAGQLQNELSLASTMRVLPSCTLSDITHFRLNDYRGGDQDANVFVGIYGTSTTPNVVRLHFTKPTGNMDIGRSGYMNVSTVAGGNCKITLSAEL